MIGNRKKGRHYLLKIQITSEQDHHVKVQQTVCIHKCLNFDRSVWNKGKSPRRPVSNARECSNEGTISSAMRKRAHVKMCKRRNPQKPHSNDEKPEGEPTGSPGKPHTCRKSEKIKGSGIERGA